MKNLFIGSTVRCGGSLLARLFDHHPAIGAYPFELHLPMDEALHPSLANRGEKDQVQNFPTLRADQTPQELAAAIGLDPNAKRCLVGSHFPGGKLAAKTRHLDIDAEFDHEVFLDRFHSGVEKRRQLGDVYGSLHRAFFSTWDGGAHGGSLETVVYHRANGLLSDVGRFFQEFDDSRLIVPLRSASSCLASEKRKVLSQLVAGGVAGRLRPSDRLLRYFGGRFAEASLVNWLVTFTRAYLLKQRFPERVVVYRFEDLASHPENTMRRLCDALAVEYHPNLLRPTNGGHEWAGNSMFGAQRGINAEMANDRDLLNKTERKLVARHAGALVEYLEGQPERLVDFEGLPASALFDHDLQARYFDDREKTALYFASLYERWKFRSVGERVRETFSRKPRPHFL